MKLYSPFHLTFDESQDVVRNFDKDVKEMNVSDEMLEEYTDVFLKHYRATLEEFFAPLTPLILFYNEYPFETLILRVGNNGVIIGYRPSSKSSKHILRPIDLDPPLKTQNIFDVVQYFRTPFVRFDFSIRQYDAVEAETDGKRQALSDALTSFWQTVNEETFYNLCIELLEAEKIKFQNGVSLGDMGFDAIGEILFAEPAGFRRFEKWAFEFKHYRKNRVSASNLRQIEAFLDSNDGQFDFICLITSGDLTSVGNHIAVKNPRIRIWDRNILQVLVNKHLDILKNYFAEYQIAIDRLSQKSDTPTSEEISRFDEFKQKLGDCSPGKKHSTKYENIGVELWEYLFPLKLGKPKPQSRTIDGKQRRDVLFRNQRNGRFFQRIAEKYNSDFLIIDFKNYSKPIKSSVIYDVTKYANQAIGRFIVVVSRNGADDTVNATQGRLLRDRNTLVVVVSDEQLLEMIVRKESGEAPEDVIEDIMDEILLQF